MPLHNEESVKKISAIEIRVAPLSSRGAVQRQTAVPARSAPAATRDRSRARSGWKRWSSLAACRAIRISRSNLFLLAQLWQPIEAGAGQAPRAASRNAAMPRGGASLVAEDKGKGPVLLSKLSSRISTVKNVITRPSTNFHLRNFAAPPLPIPPSRPVAACLGNLS